MDPATLAIVIGLVASFATLVTAHLWLAIGLTARKPWWRGPVALVVPPLAPWWGLDAGLRLRSALWITGACGYVVTRILAGW
ncbi:MAG: hypothetical protein IT376_09260 [Polyangiaceae bacterium]|nr:hypothetical protein [Polyangiaceae bacterium]